MATALIGLAAMAAFLVLWLAAPNEDAFASEQAVAVAGPVVDAMASTKALDAEVGEGDRPGDETPTAADPIDGSPSLSGIAAEGYASTITLDRTTVSINGEGVEVDAEQRVITLTAAGVYTIRGELTDGRIVVDAGDNDTVTIVLDGARIVCSTFSPIHVINADEVILSLADGSVNYIEDGDTYLLDEGADEPNAAIFSADDLTITGDGALTVIAHYNNGIQSKDDLLISGGDLSVTAANDAIKGRDSITVRTADITVDAGGDGLQSNNDVDPTKGTVLIESGTLTIDAGADGIQAKTTLTIEDGDLTVVTGGGSANSSTVAGGRSVNGAWGAWGPQGTTASTVDTPSAKGLKAGSELTILGGTIDIDSSDDSVHSNGVLRIDGGRITATSGDDGIHADTSLEINGGDITIGRSYEGIESMEISLNGGTIRATSSDDGINAAGGNDASAFGRPGQNPFSSSTACSLAVRGGYIVVDAGGDGLDINGPITMDGGTVIIHGPTENMNGALDYSGSFQLTGGYLIAAGSVGMAQAPSTSSAQNSVMINTTSAISAGTLIHIEDAAGESVVTFQPSKTCQSFVISSAQLETGSTYEVYIGGTSTGSNVDGVIEGGTYTPGSRLGSFTISTRTTLVGTASRMPGQPGGWFP